MRQSLSTGDHFYSSLCRSILALHDNPVAYEDTNSVDSIPFWETQLTKVTIRLHCVSNLLFFSRMIVGMYPHCQQPLVSFSNSMVKH